MLSNYPLTIGLVVGSGDLLDEVMACITELPVRIAIDQRKIGDWSVFLEKLDRTRLDVILVELSQLDDPLEDVVRQIRATSSFPTVVLVHTSAQPETILRAIRAGVSEYVYPPLKADLCKALERLARERASNSAGTHPRGKVLGFIPAKGGCGTTTIACHVAVELQKQTNLQVLLADFDTETGIIGFLMKSQSRYSLRDAVANVHRLDLSFWKALVSNGRGGVEVIVAPPDPSPAGQCNPDELLEILRFVRSNYDWTVVDLGRTVSVHTTSMLDEIDEAFLVTTPDIPSLHRAKQVAEHLLRGYYESKRLHLIINRAPRRMELTLGELEIMLGAPVYATLPNQETELYEAYAEGELVSPKGKLGKQFSQLAAKIAGVQRQTKRMFSLMST